MAFGSAIPELTVNAISSARAVLGGVAAEGSGLVAPHLRRLLAPDVIASHAEAELGVGAIVGSGLIAFLVIPSFCAFVSPEPLRLKRRPLLRDMSAYAVAALLLRQALRRGAADLTTAISLVACYVSYVSVVVLGRPVRLWWRERFPAVGYWQEDPELPHPSSSTSVFRERYISEAVSESMAFFSERSNLELAPWAPELAETLVPLRGEEKDYESPEMRLSMPRWTRRAVRVALQPVSKATSATCPDCRITREHEKLYGVTFLASLAWICLHSFVITAICGRFVARLQQPGMMGLLGLLVVSVGAEVPDMAQAIAVAKRGYGSMAVSACVGSQIVNICCGLGWPWLLCAIAGTEVQFPGNPRFLNFGTSAVLLAVLLQVVQLLGVALASGAPKALLGLPQAQKALCLYGLVLIALTVAAAFL